MVNRLNILVTSESTQGIAELLKKTAEFFKKYDWDIRFFDRNENQGFHAHLTIKDLDTAKGGADIKRKNNGRYEIKFYFGELKYAFTYESILIHEILHLFFQEFGLGDIHYRPGASMMGQKNNDNAMRHWLYYAKLRNNNPNKSIVHHTANLTWDYNRTRKYHIETKGWNDIAYHYFIEKNGDLKIGRWLAKEGSHCIGQNTKSAGICLAGNYSQELPTGKQEATLKKLLIDLGFNEVGPHRRYQAYRICYGRNISDDWAKNLIMLQLVKTLVRPETYALLKGKKYWIVPVTMLHEGHGEAWDEAKIKIISEKELADYPDGGIFGNFQKK